MIPETGRGLGRQNRAEHVGARRHGVLARAPLGERVRAGEPGDADETFGVRVVRLELVVVDRPVDDVGTVDRTELGSRLEVDGAKARQLAIGVKAATADGRRQVVDLAREHTVAVVDGAAIRPRLEERIGSEEVAPKELDLVVRHVTERIERRVEREEMIAALLEHDHRPARAREHVGRGRTRRPGADDDRVAIPVDRFSHGR